jgi:hypothetical protein
MAEVLNTIPQGDPIDVFLSGPVGVADVPEDLYVHSYDDDGDLLAAAAKLGTATG